MRCFTDNKHSMLESIKIKKLFGLFDYHITLDTSENITILTGPNGYGKTTILNIIYHFFNQQFSYFQKLNFESISFEFSENKRMELTKKEKKAILTNNTAIFPRVYTDIHINFFDSEKKIGTFIYDSELRELIANELKNFFSLRQIEEDLWINTRTNEKISLNNFLNLYKEQLPEHFLSLIKKKQSEEENNPIIIFLNSLNIYLIKEQRLLHKIFGRYKDKDTFLNTIELYAEELKKLIEEKQLEAYQITQKLDSSFPKRLIEAKTVIDEATFKERFAKLKDKQSKLQQFGITTTEQEIPDYNTESAKVLSVYLNDSEEKLSVYDDLLTKIDLFVSIISQKDFAFKTLQISSNKGFSFYQNKTLQPLSLTDLSSGEQHEVVLLYELLFKTAPNTLILIDEPEISLHVIWQKVFIDDLKRIGELKKISFLVSTHSPQIINNYWELTRDLFELSNAKEHE